MRFPSPTSRPSVPLLLVGLVALVTFGVSPAFAQYGASPSQTGMFFNDLHGRIQQREQQSGVRSGEAVYDYSRGVYIGGGNEERMMGEDAGFSANEAVRQMGQPAVRSGYAGYSSRAAGDYTQYSGPYPSTTSFFAPTYVSDPFLGGRRNLKLGPVNVGFGLSGMVEYNDNVSRAHENPVSDFIASGFLSIDANYQFTRNNAFSVTTTIGFDHYFDHPELAPYGGDFVLNVLPGSTLAFDVKVGPVNFIIYDRMSVRPATRSDFALDPTEIFGVFQNDAGVAASWAVNSEINLSLNLMRSDANALESSAEIYDRVMHTVAGSLGWSPQHTWTLGVEGSVSWVHYPQGYNNDGTLTNAGVFFSTPIGRNTFFRASGGLQDFNFDAPPSFSRSVTDADIASTQSQISSLQSQLAKTRDLATQSKLNSEINSLNSKLAQQQASQQTETSRYNSNNRDSNSLSDYYYNVTISNQLNARISQSISFGHESALNTTSNFVTADYLSYGVGIIAWRGSRISLSGYYENSKESGGLQKEDLRQRGLDAYISHQLSSRVRLGAGYHFGVTTSSLPDRDYVQNAFNVDLSFAISRKLSVALGYRYWTTDADDDVNDFDQNRAIVQVNYNFGP